MAPDISEVILTTLDLVGCIGAIGFPITDSRIRYAFPVSTFELTSYTAGYHAYTLETMSRTPCTNDTNKTRTNKKNQESMRAAKQLMEVQKHEDEARAGTKAERDSMPEEISATSPKKARLKCACNPRRNEYML